MSFRQLMILNKCYLSIEKNSIKIKREDDQFNLIPLDDVAIIVIDNQECVLSMPFISQCSEHNIVIMACGRRHFPISMILPVNNHYRLYDVLMMQMAQTDLFKSEVCEALLKAKLANQKRVLTIIGAEEDKIKMFDEYIEEISGIDEINREGTAAKVFFNALYGQDYIRFDSDPVNNTQNYGYAVMSACISRHLSILGFNLCIGVHHRGLTNAFNLTYDIIEPFRALVDYYIYSNYASLTDELNIQTKKELVNLLNIKVKVRDMVVTVQYAIEMLCKSYLRLLETHEGTLDLPEIIETNFLKENESV